MLLNGIPSHHLQTAPRPTRAILRRGRGAELLLSAYKWSSILQVTKPRLPRSRSRSSSRSIYLREIHRQIDHNEMLQRRLAHSTKLLRDAECIAIGEGNAPAPQAVRPLATALPNAPIPLLDWRQLCTSKCPGPPRRRMRPAKITRHKVHFQSTFLKYLHA